MDQRTDKIFECERIRECLASFAITESTRKTILSLNPFKSIRELIKSQKFILEQKTLFEKDLEFPIHKLVSVDELLQKLIPEDWMLSAEELLKISRFLETIRLCRQFLSTHKKDIPLHYEMFSDLKPFPEIESEIKKKIDEKGEVRDNASNELRDIRVQIKKSESRLSEKMQGILNSLSGRNILQDIFYTQRQGRYVIPVRSSAKGKIQGIVHDASSSGETLFIEPIEVIELANELQNLRLMEKEEIRKILLNLTRKVREHRQVLCFDESLMTQLDFIIAKSRFGFHYDLHLPLISEDEPLKLLSIHHPLLFIFKKNSSVPIDLRVRAIDRVILITGPNTGGKTTALKTVGLNAWMALSGLPIPASPDSVIPFFENLFADIGDEQNVTEGLSTFSSHIRNLKRILETVSKNSLVLLDELGTATDPQEGGALACAILEENISQANLTIATSHLPILKQWAHSRSDTRNASFHLDETTQAPTFKITMDIPGSSEAFIIAKREGISDGIIERAKTFLSKGESDLSNLLLSLQEKEKELSFLRQQTAAIKETNEALKLRYEALTNEIKHKKLTFQMELLDEKEGILQKLREEIESKIASLPSRKDLSILREEVAKKQKETLSEKRRIEKEFSEKDLKPIDSEIEPGSLVFIALLNEVGVLKSLDFKKNRAVVEVRGKELKVPADSLSIPLKGEIKLPQRQEKSIQFKKKDHVPLELNLHGKRVEPALSEIDKFLNDAAMNDLPYVRLCHGHGTGILRRAIHDYLRTHPLVKNFRYASTQEGGSAITIVEFK